MFVDTEAGVNTAIRKVRRALGESAERPVYIDTVPGKGYRFIAPVISVAAATHVTIAVLPFANLSGDPSHDYLADGLTEETIAALGQVDPDRLSVIGRTSTIRYRKTRKSLHEIAGELGASYVVESSIRGEDAWLRITSRLIRVQDGSVLWSAAYDRHSINVLRLQRKLCRAIADEIRVRLSPERVARLGRRQTTNADAYDLYCGAARRGTSSLRGRRSEQSTSTPAPLLSTRITRSHGPAWPTPTPRDRSPATAGPPTSGSARRTPCEAPYRRILISPKRRRRVAC